MNFVLKLRWLLLPILLVIPGRLLYEQFSVNTGFLGVLYLDKSKDNLKLPEVARLPDEVYKPSGYDGQFYAQVALDPLLQQEDLILALDNPSYRARRIGLPALAWIVGIGIPWWVLQAYSLLNVVFWILLFFILIKYIGFRSWRDLFLGASLLLTSGTLVSMGRALPDLPAVVMSTLAIFVGSSWILAATCMAFGGLIKETTAFSFISVLMGIYQSRKNSLKRVFLGGLIMVLPMGLWFAYVYTIMPNSSVSGYKNFSIPFIALVDALMDAGHNLLYGGDDGKRITRIEGIVETTSLYTLCIQAIYMILKVRWHDKFWLMGISFAFLLTVLGPSVLCDYNAYTRVLLPLTFSFNLLLHKYAGHKEYFLLFVLGNFGLFSLALQQCFHLMGYTTSILGL